MEKDTLELRVKVTGSPEPKLAWYSNDKELLATPKVKMTKKKDGVHLLKIANTRPAMSGLYRVVATNVAGEVEHTATVTVTGRHMCHKVECVIDINTFYYTKLLIRIVKHNYQRTFYINWIVCHI